MAGQEGGSGNLTSDGRGGREVVDSPTRHVDAKQPPEGQLFLRAGNTVPPANGVSHVSHSLGQDDERDAPAEASKLPPQLPPPDHLDEVDQAAETQNQQHCIKSFHLLLFRGLASRPVDRCSVVMARSLLVFRQPKSASRNGRPKR